MALAAQTATRILIMIYRTKFGATIHGMRTFSGGYHQYQNLTLLDHDALPDCAESMLIGPIALVLKGIIGSIFGTCDGTSRCQENASGADFLREADSFVHITTLHVLASDGQGSISTHLQLPLSRLLQGSLLLRVSR